MRSLVWDMQSSDQGLTECFHTQNLLALLPLPLLPPHLLLPRYPPGHCHCPLPKQWEATLIKALCPVQDWRKSNKLRECPEESNKNWLNRPFEERLRELGLFSARVAGGGNNKFSRNKRISCKTFFFFFKLVTVGYSTEDSREGVLMIFLLDISKQPLLLSLPMGLYWLLALWKFLIALGHSFKNVVGLRYCEVTGAW